MRSFLNINKHMKRFLFLITSCLAINQWACAQNVGIGTTTPAYKLDVVGNINTNVGYTVNGAAASGAYLRGNGTNFVSSTIPAADLSAGIAGTVNYLAKFTGANSIGNSVIVDNGSTVTVSPSTYTYFNTGSVYTQNLLIARSGITNDGGNLTLSGSSNIVNVSSQYFYLNSGNALQGTDSWLRLNQAGSFSSGTYTPGFLRADGGLVSGGIGSPGAGNFATAGTAAIGTNLSVAGTSSLSGLVSAGSGISASGTAYVLYGGNATINANADNHNGGGIAVSDDGGFYDFNDGPVTFLGSTGLRIAGSSGASSANAYLRVNALAGTGSRAVYADANGILTAASKNLGYYVNKAGFTMSYPGNHTDVMQTSPATTSAITVVTGDVVVIQASYKFKLNGGSGTDQPKYGFIVTGACGTINVIDQTQNEYGDDVPRSQAGMQHETWIWVATCSGSVQFTWGLDWVNFDDAAILSDFVYTATKY